MWHVRVPATTANLGSGLDTLGMALNRWLTCWFEIGPELVIELQGEGHDTLPRDQTNLVWQAGDALYRHLCDAPMPKGHLKISSDIPLGRGLGSSAAAIVAGLLLANQQLPDPLSPHQLLQWAGRLEGHYDNVAAAIHGGLILVWTDIETVRSEPLPLPALPVLLAIPGYVVSTKLARAGLPTMVTRDDAIFNAQRLALWVKLAYEADWSRLHQAGEDRLHQPYRKAMVPGMDGLLSTALAHGAHLAALSGSGPAVLMLVKPDRMGELKRAMTAEANRGSWQGEMVLMETHSTPVGAECRWISAPDTLTL